MCQGDVSADTLLPLGVTGLCHGDVSADTKCVSGYVPMTHYSGVCQRIRPPDTVRPHDTL